MLSKTALAARARVLVPFWPRLSYLGRFSASSKRHKTTSQRRDPVQASMAVLKLITSLREEASASPDTMRMFLEVYRVYNFWSCCQRVMPPCCHRTPHILLPSDKRRTGRSRSRWISSGSGLQDIKAYAEMAVLLQEAREGAHACQEHRGLQQNQGPLPLASLLA